VTYEREMKEAKKREAFEKIKHGVAAAKQEAEHP
jgi:hypothetical protein